MPTFTRADQEQFEKARDLLETAPPKELGFVKSLFFGYIKSCVHDDDSMVRF